MDIWWLQQETPGSWTSLLGALLIGHALADYALQTDFMARAKNRHLTRAVSDAPPGTLWLYVLSAHAAIHAGAVWILTGCGWLGLAEFILHWLIDWLRMENRISFCTDQFTHLGCKAVYVALMVWC
jgi:hypothetical protein